MDEPKTDILEEVILFTVTDPIGIVVTFYQNQWNHIKERHPEIKPVSKIRSTVKAPDFIHTNDERASRIYTTATSTNLYFNVFAGIVSESECKVITSYLTKDVPKGDCIWQRQKK